MRMRKTRPGTVPRIHDGLEKGRIRRDTHGMTFPTAAKAMQTLLASGVARELTGKRRNRVFV
jgi:hypothetical protein